MRRQLFHGAILLLEGALDSRFIKRFIDPDRSMSVVAHGRENAIAAMNVLHESGVGGVIAIIDADFDPLLGALPGIPGLLTYDFRDVEIMLLHSPAFDKLLEEFGSSEKIQRFQETEGLDVRTALLNRGREIVKS